MKRFIDLVFGLLIGLTFSIAITIVLLSMLIVIVPFLLYFSIKETLRFLSTTKYTK